MSLSRVLMAGFAFVTCCSLAAYAVPVTMKLRPGLWEMTSKGQTSGSLPIPADVLARLPPDRRAKMEAAIAASQARAATPHVSRQCITAESLQRGLELDERRERGCQETIVSSSSSEMNIQVECKSPQHSTSGTMHFSAAGLETLAGTVNMKISDGGHSLMINRVIEGKWIAADCGNLKPKQ